MWHYTPEAFSTHAPAPASGLFGVRLYTVQLKLKREATKPKESKDLIEIKT